jgi:hypothetical protein
MMNSLAPLIGSVIDPQQIAKHVLQFGFGIKSPGKFMMPPPPPMPMGPDGQPMPEDPNAMPAGGPPMGPDAGMGPPKGEPGMNGEQMNPMDLLMAQQAGGMEQAGMQPAAQTNMSQTGQGGLPPELLAQLQNQMGLQL